MDDTLSQFQALKKPVDLKRAFTNEFVDAAYEGGKLTRP